jgi:septal ring factor EnvC (AmiA/AmiB activator)
MRRIIELEEFRLARPFTNAGFTKETTMKVLFGCAVLAMIVCANVLAQQESIPPVASLAALTSEVHLLRVAVEKSTQTQTQLQGLSVYLSAQQSRLIQTSARVDTIRKDLDIAFRDSKTLADRLAAARDILASEPNPDATDEHSCRTG